jgi:hypothetical protein
MKQILKKLILILASVFTLFGSSKRKGEQPMSDAINMRNQGDEIILEDFEMAAYHNHA